MKDNFKIDEFDYKVIKLFKWGNEENPVTLDKLKAIWGERCALDPEDVDIQYITEHFLTLTRKLDLFGDFTYREFIYNLDYAQNWKFTCTSRAYFNKDTTDFDLILLSRLDSLFSLAHVSDLPGYKEWNDKFCPLEK